MKEYLTVEEVAPYCHTSVWTIYRRIKEGAIACVRAGGGRNLLIPAHEVCRFLTQHGLPVPEGLAKGAAKTRVLLVDDDEKLVRSLERYFTRRPEYEFKSASSGFAAGMAIQSFRPQVVLLDIMLGDMDGRELLATVRKDPQFGSTRVIALSGYLRDGEVAGLLSAGFDDYLAKPFALPDLVARIAAVLIKAGSV